MLHQVKKLITNLRDNISLVKDFAPHENTQFHGGM